MSQKVEEFLDLSELIDKVEAEIEYDIYLLDIYMARISEISIGAELRVINCISPIIFLTSFSDHDIEAFGIDATHYLLKPYEQDEFSGAMDKAIRVIGNQPLKNLLLKTIDGYYNVSVTKITYCELENHNQRICLMNRDLVYVRISSRKLSEKLAPLEYFYSCGKTYIVNLERIERMMSDSVKMQNGTVNEFEGKLYIQTGKVKPTSHQLAVNPKAEICAFADGAWIRVACELVEDDRVEAKKSMLDAYPNLRGMYDENDGNTQVFYMKNAAATFCAFGREAEVVEF